MSRVLIMNYDDVHLGRKNLTQKPELKPLCSATIYPKLEHTMGFEVIIKFTICTSIF